MAKLKSGVSALACAAAVLFAVIAFLMLCAPAVGYTVMGSEISYSGAQVTFGYTEVTEVLGHEVRSEILSFSFANLLIYILLLAGIVFAVLSVLGKLEKVSPLISALCLLVAAILFFCSKNFCNPANIENADLVAEFRNNLSLGAGAIVGGIFSLLACLAVGVSKFIKR